MLSCTADSLHLRPFGGLFRPVSGTSPESPFSCPSSRGNGFAAQKGSSRPRFAHQAGAV